MKLIAEEFYAVNKQLANLFVENECIKNIISDFLCGGSKRIRTHLTVLYLKALGCEISSDSIKIMVVGEMIHNASLLHDDVIDDAVIRRGKVTVGKEFSPQISILLGDYILSLATDILLGLENQHVLKKFLNCIKQMCNSEFNQYFLRGKIPTLEEYIQICEGKTACLFETILESCAIIEGIDAEKARQFAHNFGILFQLKNDLKEDSAKADFDNNIFTPKDFLGIEKTVDLMDNYQRRLIHVLEEFPDNAYKKGLEDLI